MTSKVSRSIEKSWERKANEALDQIEVRPEELSKLTWNVICRASGVSRTTLWRNEKIRARFLELQDIHRGIIRPAQRKRRSRELDLLDRIRQENSVLRRENHGHLANYIEIAKRLEERGIDPVQIFAGLTATAGKIGAGRRR